MTARQKTIVITGATGGVGRGIAIACGEAGWEVWIAARRKPQGEDVAPGRHQGIEAGGIPDAA